MSASSFCSPSHSTIAMTIQALAQEWPSRYLATTRHFSEGEERRITWEMIGWVQIVVFFFEENGSFGNVSPRIKVFPSACFYFFYVYETYWQICLFTLFSKFKTTHVFSDRAPALPLPLLRGVSGLLHPERLAPRPRPLLHDPPQLREGGGHTEVGVVGAGVRLVCCKGSKS